MKQYTSCRSVLFGPFYWRKPEFPERNHRPAASHCDKLYYIEITLVLLPIDNSQATVDEK